MSELSDLPLRPDLRGQTPYGAPQLKVSAALNVNENNFGVPESAIAAMLARVEAVLNDLNRYPDREFVALREQLARYLNGQVGTAPKLGAANLWAANGSNEILQQVLLAFGGSGRKLMSFSPTYSMYPTLARITMTEFVELPRRRDFSVDVSAAIAEIESSRPDLVFICTPNNPTGGALTVDEIAAIADANPGITLVDEAYAEFSDVPSSTILLPDRPRLMVSRTMSKAFALAGLRLGYLAADPAVIDALRLVRLPYHLSALTQAVASAALEHAADFMPSIASIRAERDRMARLYADLGLRVADSQANFLLLEGLANPQRVFESLLEQGVLVRQVSIPNSIRVSIGRPEENDTAHRLIAALLG
jgi:histidinol-phosphate aminotransferase